MDSELVFQMNTVWGVKLFRKCFVKSIRKAVGLYCSCHAAQGNKGNFQKTYYKTFGESCRPRMYASCNITLTETCVAVWVPGKRKCNPILPSRKGWLHWNLINEEYLPSRQIALSEETLFKLERDMHLLCLPFEAEHHHGHIVMDGCVAVQH